jgi:hypothetical protein
MTHFRNRLKFHATLLAITLAISGLNWGLADDSGPAEVMVLSTLHQLHEQTEGYSFQDLSEIIEQLRPDILAVELTASDLQRRRDQSVKQEYQRSVFPLLDRHNYEVVPLEPSQPLYGELVGLMRAAQERLSEQHPDRLQSFNLYTESLYQILTERWDSAAEVNSSTTDVLFDTKHRFQSAIFGPDEARVWEEWNRHFLKQILNTASANPGKRILVLVGAEHAYWLRAQLANSDVILSDTELLLESLGRAEPEPEPVLRVIEQ